MLGTAEADATPRDRWAQGVGFLSEDRKEEGLMLTQSLADNITLSRLTPYSRWGWLNLRRRRDVEPGGGLEAVPRIPGHPVVSTRQDGGRSGGRL